MKYVTTIILACLLASVARGQFCALPVPQVGGAAGNWWDGLSMSGLWIINDGVGTNIAASVGGVNGTLRGVPNWSITTPTALLFNQSSAYTNTVTMGDVFDIGTNSVSFGAWFRIDAYKRYAGIINKGSIGSSPTHYSMNLDTTSKRIQINFGLVAYDIPVDWPTNVWTHVLATSDRTSGVNIYTNGIMALSATNKLDAGSLGNPSTLHVGNLADDNTITYTFIGAIRDVFVRLSPSGMTAQNAETIYSATKSTYGK